MVVLQSERKSRAPAEHYFTVTEAKNSIFGKLGLEAASSLSDDMQQAASPTETSFC